MGYVQASIILSNPSKAQLKPITTNALVDYGSLFLCVPQHIAVQLELNELEKREVTIADGSKKLVPYVGSVRVSFENRNCFVGAMVLGDEVLLGAILLEDMDLVIEPSKRKLSVNPDSPNFASAKVK